MSASINYDWLFFVGTNEPKNVILYIDKIY